MSRWPSQRVTEYLEKLSESQQWHLTQMENCLVAAGVEASTAADILQHKLHDRFRYMFDQWRLSEMHSQEEEERAERNYNSLRESHEVETKKLKVQVEWLESNVATLEAAKPGDDFSELNRQAYVLRAIGTPMFKFGSGDPRQRVKGCQTGCPYKLKIVVSFDGGSYVEKALHKILRALCRPDLGVQPAATGEWFEIADPDAFEAALGAIK